METWWLMVYEDGVGKEVPWPMIGSMVNPQNANIQAKNREYRKLPAPSRNDTGGLRF
jgi:hypothetical protein